MKKIIFIFLSILSIFNYANAKDFFLNITDQIVENEFRLSYGVSVTDVNKDNKYDFIVSLEVLFPAYLPFSLMTHIGVT